MAEVRVMAEGALRWINASGSGSAWATASAATSGLFGFVRSFSFTSAKTITTVMERGVPHHHKVVSHQPIQVTFQLAWTGTIPTAISGSGASVPMQHLEFKSLEAERGGGTARFYQFHGVPMESIQFSEGEQENTIQFTTNALAMNGVTASGYLG